MSKYTEAEEHLICFLTECSMWCKENHLTETFKRAIEALQIADRLEQVDSDVYNKFCNKFHNDCYSQYKCYEDGHKCEEAGSYVYGYRQALADLRGENND